MFLYWPIRIEVITWDCLSYYSGSIPLLVAKFYSGENEHSAGLISLASGGATPPSATKLKVGMGQ